MSPWKILSKQGVTKSITSIPSNDGKIKIVGSQNDSFCCCKKGDCILSISVIDEDTTIGYSDPDARDRDYASFRENYPTRNLVVLRPQSPPAWYCGGSYNGDCSIYTAQEWRDKGDKRFGPLVLPEGWGDSGLDYIATVLREEKEGRNDPEAPADDWFEVLLNMGVIDPDGTNTNPNKLVITKTFGKIAIFLDNSGSMVVAKTVPKSLELFQKRLAKEMGISVENKRLLMLPGSSEVWIGPHISIPGEDCEPKACCVPPEAESSEIESVTVTLEGQDYSYSISRLGYRIMKATYSAFNQVTYNAYGLDQPIPEIDGNVEEVGRMEYDGTYLMPGSSYNGTYELTSAGGQRWEYIFPEDYPFCSSACGPTKIILDGCSLWLENPKYFFSFGYGVGAPDSNGCDFKYDAINFSFYGFGKAVQRLIESKVSTSTLYTRVPIKTNLSEQCNFNIDLDHKLWVTSTEGYFIDGGTRNNGSIFTEDGLVYEDALPTTEFYTCSLKTSNDRVLLTGDLIPAWYSSTYDPDTQTFYEEGLDTIGQVMGSNLIPNHTYNNGTLANYFKYHNGGRDFTNSMPKEYNRMYSSLVPVPWLSSYSRPAYSQDFSESGEPYITIKKCEVKFKRYDI